jgi:hypothetical protein
MPEPFGKLNRRVAITPVSKKKRITPPPQSGSRAKLYLYLAGGLLFLIMAGYALAL